MIILQKRYYSLACLEYADDKEKCERWSELPFESLTGRWRITQEGDEVTMYIEEVRDGFFGKTKQWRGESKLRFIEFNDYINGR